MSGAQGISCSHTRAATAATACHHMTAKHGKTANDAAAQPVCTCLETPAEASSHPCSSNSRAHTMSVQQLLPGRERWWCAGGRKEATSRRAAGACQLGCQADAAAGKLPLTAAAAAALLLPWLRALLARPPRLLLPSLALLPSLLLLLLHGCWLLVAAACPAPAVVSCRWSRSRCRLSCGGPGCCVSCDHPAEGTSASRAWSHRLSDMASGTTAASVVALGTRARAQGSSAGQLLVAAGRSPSPRPAKSVQLRERFCRSQHAPEPPGCRSRASATQYTQSLESQLAERPSGRQPPSSGCRGASGTRRMVTGVGDVEPAPQGSQDLKPQPAPGASLHARRGILRRKPSGTGGAGRNIGGQTQQHTCWWQRRQRRRRRQVATPVQARRRRTKST